MQSDSESDNDSCATPINTKKYAFQSPNSRKRKPTEQSTGSTGLTPQVKNLSIYSPDKKQKPESARILFSDNSDNKKNDPHKDNFKIQSSIPKEISPFKKRLIMFKSPHVNLESQIKKEGVTLPQKQDDLFDSFGFEQTEESNLEELLKNISQIPFERNEELLQYYEEEDMGELAKARKNELYKYLFPIIDSKHIFTIAGLVDEDISSVQNQNGGFHHIEITPKQILAIQTRHVNYITKVFNADIKNGKNKNSTFFPRRWTKSDVIKSIQEAANSGKMYRSRTRIIGKGMGPNSETLYIEMCLHDEGILIKTAFPILYFIDLTDPRYEIPECLNRCTIHSAAQRAKQNESNIKYRFKDNKGEKMIVVEVAQEKKLAKINVPKGIYVVIRENSPCPSPQIPKFKKREIES